MADEEHQDEEQAQTDRSDTLDTVEQADTIAAVESPALRSRVGVRPGRARSARDQEADDALRVDQAPASKVDRFTVLERLGAGGMGVVYTAYDPRLDRRIALKLVKASRPAAKKHVLREARALAKLTHPNVVHVYDAQALEDIVYIAMEYIEGGTLRWWCKARERTTEEIVGVYCQAARGLVAAHEAGLVHGDFKPDNVLIGSDGRARVADFGLARRTLVTREDSGGRDERTLLSGGTPAYMSPEQWRDEPVTAASDQWAFGVALYEALHGERPFGGETLEELRENVEAGCARPVSPSSAANRRVQAIVDRALSLEASARFPDMASLVAELQRVSSPKPWRWRMALGIAALVAGALFFALGSIGGGKCDEAAADVARIWNGERRGAMRVTLEGAEAASPGTTRRLLDVLDRYAAGLSTRQIRACRRTREEGVQSEELMDRRLSCLDGKQMALGSFVETVLSAHALSSPVLLLAAASLPSLRSCDDSESLLRAVPRTRDPQLRAKEDELIRRLTAAKTEFTLRMRPVGARLVAVALMVEATALPSADLQARAHLHLGWLLHIFGEVILAQEQLYLALRSAYRSGSEEEIVSISAKLMRNALARGDVSAAMALHASALGSLDRLPERGVAQAMLLHAMGRTWVGMKNHEKAAEFFLRAYSRWPAEESAVPAVIVVDHALGQLSLGHFDAARETVSEAEATITQKLGKGSSSLLFLRANLALFPEYASARPELQLEAIARALRSTPPEDAMAVTAYRRLTMSALNARKAALALEYADRALARGAALEPPLRRSKSRELRARALLRLRRLSEAKEDFEKVIATRRRIFGSDSASLSAPLRGLGIAATQLGEIKLAVRSLESARTLVGVAGGYDTKVYRSILSDLAEVYLRQKDYASAAATFATLVAIYESSNETSGAPLVKAMTNLGHSLGELGQYDEAADVLQRAVRLLEGRKDAPHSAIAYPLSALARVEARRGRTALAMKYARRSMELFRRYPRSLELARVRMILVGLHLAAGRRGAARSEARAVEKALEGAKGVEEVELLQELRDKELL